MKQPLLSPATAPAPKRTRRRARAQCFVCSIVLVGTWLAGTWVAFRMFNDTDPKHRFNNLLVCLAWPLAVAVGVVCFPVWVLTIIFCAVLLAPVELANEAANVWMSHTGFNAYELHVPSSWCVAGEQARLHLDTSACFREQPRLFTQVSS